MLNFTSHLIKITAIGCCVTIEQFISKQIPQYSSNLMCNCWNQMILLPFIGHQQTEIFIIFIWLPKISMDIHFEFGSVCGLQRGTVTCIYFSHYGWHVRLLARISFGMISTSPLVFWSLDRKFSPDKVVEVLCFGRYSRSDISMDGVWR